MKDIEIDFYTAFDGDEEIVFFEKIGNYIKKIRIWQGYFRGIMDRMEQQDDNLTCLYYYHNMNIGWNDDESWKIPNLEEALLELKSIEIPVDNSTDKIYDNAEQRILNELIIMVSEAIDKKSSVYIQRY
jgi:hypothetical protein